MKGKKVLFVIDTLQLGGTEQSLVENLTRFENIEPIVCHIYPGETLKKAFTDKGIKVFSLDVRKKYGFLTAFKKLKEIVRNEKPALMVGYLTRSEIVTRLVGRFNHIPVIGTFVSDLYGDTYNQHLSWKARKLVWVFKNINRITGKKCIGFVANSKWVKETNSRNLAVVPEKIEVITRGRDSAKFRPKDFTTNHNGQPIKFLNIGRLFTVKGQKELITGFRNFLQKYPDATLTIIGDGPLRVPLSTQIMDYGLQEKIMLLGARSDIPDIISQFDCFIFPSFSEGFSGSVVEAMFAGLPVLASNIPPNEETIDHLHTGYLFPKGSVEEIQKAMEWYYTNQERANAFAVKAHQVAKEKFELKDIAKQFEQYLQNKISSVN